MIPGLRRGQAPSPIRCCVRPLCRAWAAAAPSGPPPPDQAVGPAAVRGDRSYARPGADRGALVPPRPAAGRPSRRCSPPATRPVRTATCCRCSCSTTGSGDPSGDPRRRFLLDCLDELRRADRRRARAALRRPGAGDARAGRARPTRPPCTSPPTPGPTAGSATRAVERALGDVPLVRTGSPYAGHPGPRAPRATARRSRSSPPSPAPGGSTAGALRRPGRGGPLAAPASRSDEPPAVADLDGVAAARRPARRLRARPGTRFRDERLTGYDEGRDLPGTDGTSRLSAYLKYGCIHPRTLLADLAGRASPTRRSAGYTDELAWREFYADVLWHRPGVGARVPQPGAAGHGLRHRPGTPRSWSPPGSRAAPAIPIVDAGMRQLLGEA